MSVDVHQMYARRQCFPWWEPLGGINRLKTQDVIGQLLQARVLARTKRRTAAAGVTRFRRDGHFFPWLTQARLLLWVLVTPPAPNIQSPNYIFHDCIDCLGLM